MIWNAGGACKLSASDTFPVGPEIGAKSLQKPDHCASMPGGTQG